MSEFESAVQQPAGETTINCEFPYGIRVALAAIEYCLLVYFSPEILESLAPGIKISGVFTDDRYFLFPWMAIPVCGAIAYLLVALLWNERIELGEDGVTRRFWRRSVTIPWNVIVKLSMGVRNERVQEVRIVSLQTDPIQFYVSKRACVRESVFRSRLPAGAKVEVSQVWFSSWPQWLACYLIVVPVAAFTTVALIDGLIGFEMPAGPWEEIFVAAVIVYIHARLWYPRRDFDGLGGNEDFVYFRKHLMWIYGVSGSILLGLAFLYMITVLVDLYI